MRRLLVAFFAALWISGCAENPAYTEGMSLIEEGQIDAGLDKLDEAARLAPDNRRYRQAYFRQRELAVQRYFMLAETARSQAQWESAENWYKKVLAIDPQNSRAANAVAVLRTERRQREALAEAADLLKKDQRTAAEAKVRGVLAENSNNREARQLLRRIEERALRSAAAGPQLSPSVKQPISLELRDASLRQVFEAISRSTGLNFVFDHDVRQDLRTTVFVRNSSLEDVVRFVLVTNQLDRKILSENTMLVYPNSAAKQRDYQELITKSFYLANADAKSTANMIKTLVKTKDLYVDEKLNLLMMRDTPEAVRMAERLVANQDLAEPEVMLDVEVMEVGTNLIYDLGVRYPDSVSFSLVGAGGTAGQLTLREWQNRSSDLVRLTITDPALALHFKNEIDRSNLLANPRIRVKNHEKAKVHIGEKLPVITTTATATGFASQSVTYLDVGLKLEVEPNVFLDDEVGMKVGLEVSSISQTIQGANGTLTYQVGTRNAATALRLKDGETQILAGLINDEDRKTINQVPGLGDLPIIGKLFGAHQSTRDKTEIVLLITPHVIRNLARPDLRFEEFPSGTEASIGAQSLVLQSSTTAEGTTTIAKAASPSPAAAAKVLLQAPPIVPAGGEFSIQVSVDSLDALRSGLLDFAFDPARLKFVRAEPGAAISAGRDVGFRTNAPEGLGRLNVSFSTKDSLGGQGDLARLVFRTVGTAPTPPTVKLEALSLINASGQMISAQLPPPVTLKTD